MKRIYIIILLCAIVSCSSREQKWDATGVFEATEIVVSSQANGVIKQFNIAEGEKVDSGTIYGYIDTIQLNLKYLQLVSSKASVKSHTQDVSKQIAATEQQIKWQEQEKTRFEKLLKQDAATQKQVDDIGNQITVLKKQLVAQRSTLESANQGIDNELTSLDIQIAQIEDMLKNSYITSPITGTVLTKYAEQGEFAAAGKPLFSVADMDDMFIRAYITADLITQIKLGDAVKVHSDFGDKEQREYEGTVIWISDKSEFTPKTIQTRNERANLVYAVKIAVKNDGYLKIGMYGQIKVK